MSPSARCLPVVVFLAASLLAAASPSPAAASATFVVDTAGYSSSLDDCTAAPGDCSLHGAINAANASPGADTIHFAIPAGECPGGVCRIPVVADVITITEAVDIDASTQPQNGGPQANVCATESAPSHMRVEVVIEAGINGSVFSIDHETGATRIRGLAIGTLLPDRGTAVSVSSGSGHRIECNHIALDAAGTATLGTGEFTGGLFLGPATSNVTVGTNGDGVDDVSERNVFGPDSGYAALDASGSEGVVIAGNYFGLTADGDPFPVAAPVLVSYDSLGARVGSNGDGVSDEAEGNFFVGTASLYVDSSGMDLNNVLIAGNTLGLTPAGDPVRTDIGIVINRLAATSAGIDVRDNTFGWVTTGIRLDNAVGGSTVSGNTFGVEVDGVRYGGQVAIAVGGGGSHVVSDNLIRNSELYGIAVVEDGSLAAGSRDNCLVGNSTGLSNFTGTVVMFENNWWGDRSGPTMPWGGTGDPVNGLVDHDPWLTSPPRQCNTAPLIGDANFTVPEDAPVGTVVGSVTATDDGDDISFGIAAGNIGGVFAIDGVTGVISVAKALDYETTPAYVLTVQASDPFVSGSASVAVIVTDEPEAEPTFLDVPVGHTFFADVEWLAAEGITRGCNPPDNDLFCPDQAVTRGQMAAFLHRALGDVLTPGGVVEFVDDDGSVFESDIEWLGAVGVTRGCNPPTNDMFCPNAVVTRGQMAAFLARALDLPAADGIDFTDDDGSIFESDIEKLAGAGITRGCNPPTNDRFCPDDPVTRAQMAAFLHRALGT